jgi:Subtilase family
MDMLILRRAPSNGLKRPHAHLKVSSEIEALAQDLPASEIRGLRRDEKVLAATEPMPLRLVEPVAATEYLKAIGAEANVGWGVEAVGASASTFIGGGVTVAVLDTGIDRNHPAFSGVEIIGRNFTTGSPDDISDINGHGTHCAGIIFGRAVAGKRIGVAPGVTRAIIGKVLGPSGGSTGTLFSAINWAVENKAQIITMSLAIDLIAFRTQLEARGLPPKQANYQSIQVLIDNVRFFEKFGGLLRSGAAFGRSALVIAASGNASDRFALQPFLLGAGFPAATGGFLSVGALERTGDASHPFRAARFSNAGATIDGPGVGILSSVPGGGLGVLSGTSMATAYVTGVAVLWAEKLMQSGCVSAEKLLDRLNGSAQCFPGSHEADVRLVQAPQPPEGDSFTPPLVKAIEEEEQATKLDSANDGVWSDELNERRIQLIDKDIQGDITTEEHVELAELQRKAVAHRDREAPLPLEGARRLHQQLLDMKREREGG